MFGFGKKKNGINGQKELEELEKRVAKNDVKAMVELANLYSEGKIVGPTIESCLKTAFELYKLAAVQGDAKAQDKLGTFYYYGYSGIKSIKEAEKWFKLAAEQGIANAQFMMGQIYGIFAMNAMEANDFDGMNKWTEASEKWYKLAADQGHADARNFL